MAAQVARNIVLFFHVATRVIQFCLAVLGADQFILLRTVAEVEVRLAFHSVASNATNSLFCHTIMIRMESEPVACCIMNLSLCLI